MKSKNMFNYPEFTKEMYLRSTGWQCLLKTSRKVSEKVSKSNKVSVCRMSHFRDLLFISINWIDLIENVTIVSFHPIQSFSLVAK